VGVVSGVGDGEGVRLGSGVGVEAGSSVGVGVGCGLSVVGCALFVCWSSCFS